MLPKTNKQLDAAIKKIIIPTKQKLAVRLDGLVM